MSRATGRLAPVDGLRALAILGVLWSHVWLFFGNPKVVLGHWGNVPLDLQRLISSLGTGVDLFFVISGFCLYLMIAKWERLTWASYRTFVVGRWLRIAPAFYLCVLATEFVLSEYPTAPRASSLAWHLIFAQSFLNPSEVVASHFWSLSTEWQFYLFLPVLLLSVRSFGADRTLLLSLFVGLALRFATFSVTLVPSAEWVCQLPLKWLGFAWGMGVCHLHLNGRLIPGWLKGNAGVFLALGVVLAGRFLMTKEAELASGQLAVLVKTLAEPLLTLGYAALLWNAITSPSWFRRALESRPLQRLGKVSYSFYLWHWAVAKASTGLVMSFGLAGALGQNLAFLLAIAVAAPVSAISYALLERPFVRLAQQRRIIQPQAA